MNHLAYASSNSSGAQIEASPDAETQLSADVSRLALLLGVFYAGNGPYNTAEAEGEVDVECLESLKLQQIAMYDEIDNLARKIASTHPKSRSGAFLKKRLVEDYESKFPYGDDDVVLTIKRSYEHDFTRIDRMDLIAAGMTAASSRRSGLLGWFGRAQSSGEA